METIIYHNPDNGFSIVRIKEERKKQWITVLGYFASLQPGETVKCLGNWKTHPKHGIQFEVEEYEILLPSDLVGIQKYLESGLIAGIGPVYAEKIVQKFQERTLEILDQAPYRLLEIPGIGEKKIESIIRCWAEQKSIRNVMIFLRKHEVSPAYAQKIFKVYGDKSIEQVKKNPYELAKDVFGIGFKMADALAQRLGFAPHSPERIEAALAFLLWELSTEGHTCYPLEALLEKGEEMLQVSSSQLQEILQKMIQQKEVVYKEYHLEEKTTSWVWLSSLYLAEWGIGQEIQRILQGKTHLRSMNEQKALTWVGEKLSIHFAEKQKQAILASLSHKMHILTGGPGTGKSTITKALITILSQLTSHILLCAPTGRAAKRLSQITRKKAFTIHSLLELDFTKGGFKKNRDNPLCCDFLIIDEASMIDTFLMYHLLRAVPTYAKVLLIGDIDQLPSIGPGYVLKDLISSQAIPVTELSEIFRQAAYSRIIINAHRIHRGEMPDFLNVETSDFRFIALEDPPAIQAKILELVQKELPQKKQFDPFRDIQILSPMKKGEIGIERLNMLLQQTLNPFSAPFYRAGRCFHLQDKVMQIRNNYQKKVYNGDIGYLSRIDLQEQIVEVLFEDRVVEYEFSELDELVLAYAVSVHKYQGSECPCILMPIHTSHYILLYRNLLYTAVTRGKKQVILIGSKKAAAMAVKNNPVFARFTGLQRAVQEASSFLPKEGLL